MLDRFKTFYDLGFREQKDWFSVSMLFLHRISHAFVRSLTRQSALGLVRENLIMKANPDTMDNLLQGLPFMPGSHHVDASWMVEAFNQLLEVYRQKVSEYKGTVEMYLTEKNQNLRVPERIFFHLVENKDNSYPFAFRPPMPRR